MMSDRLWSWMLVLLASISWVSAHAQQDPRGIVHGRVLSATAPQGVSSARVTLVTNRVGQEFALQESVTDPNGRFRLRLGPILDRPRLRVVAKGLAPVEIPIKKTPNGEGLLLPDVILKGGATVGLRVDAALAAEAPVWVHVIPLHGHEQRIIDLDAEPLIKARFDNNGRCDLSHVSQGLYAFVVTDHFARFAPTMRVWRVGRDNIDLAPFDLRPGMAQTFTMTASARGEVDGFLLMGAGAWHPEGGEEYRFRLRTIAKADNTGQARATLQHLPFSVCDVEFKTKKTISRTRVVPNGTSIELAWIPTASIQGQLSAQGNTPNWEESLVIVGGKRARIGKNGEFSCDGLPGGSHTLFVKVPGYPAVTDRRVVLADSQERKDLLVTLKAGAVIDGETRNADIKRVGYTWVGYEELDEDPRFAGRRFYTMSDVNGAYHIDSILPGRLRLYTLPSPGMMSLEKIVKIDEGVRATEHLRFGKAGLGGGVLTGPDKEPVKGALAFLSRLPAPLGLIETTVLAGRLTDPVVHSTVTDSEGRFVFQGVTPGAHLLIFEAPGMARESAGIVNISAGTNTSGFDWRLEGGNDIHLDIPEGLPLRLRSQDHSFVDRWLHRMPGTPPITLSALPMGQYRIECMPFNLGTMPTTDLGDYVERLPSEVLGIATVPGNGVQKILGVGESRYGAVTIRLTVRGESPKETDRAELTAYPIAAEQNLMPIRMTQSGDLGRFKIDLPRGLWLVDARIPGRGHGTSAPISVGRGLESIVEEDVEIDLAGPATLIGFVDLAQLESEEGDGVFASVQSRHADLTHRWAMPEERVPLSETGNLRIPELRSGESKLRVFGPQALIDIPVEADPFELKDVRRIVPGLPAALSLALTPAARMHSVLSEGAMQKTVAKPATVLPGRYVIDSPQTWEGAIATGVRSVCQTIELQGGDILLGASEFGATGKNSVRGAVRIDGNLAVALPMQLIPYQNDAYDGSRPILRGRCNRDGDYEFKNVESGSYALRFRYSDDDGQAYQIALPISLGGARRFLRHDIRLKTRALTVVAYDAEDAKAGERALVRILRTDLRGIASTTVFRRDIEEIARGMADDTGEIVFRSVPLGTYDIEVSRNGRVMRSIKAVDLTNGSGALTVRAIGAPGLEAVLNLQDQNGDPVAGASLFVFDSSNTRIGASTIMMSDGQGRIFLRNMEEGTYKLHLSGPGLADQQLQSLTIKAGDPKNHTRRVVAGADLALECVDEEGHIVPNVEVFVDLSDGGWKRYGPHARLTDELSLTANNYGRMLLRHIPLGDCRLRAVHKGFETFTGVTRVREQRRNTFQLVFKRKR